MLDWVHNKLEEKCYLALTDNDFLIIMKAPSFFKVQKIQTRRVNQSEVDDDKEQQNDVIMEEQVDSGLDVDIVLASTQIHALGSHCQC